MPLVLTGMRMALILLIAVAPATAHAATVRVTTGPSGAQRVVYAAAAGETNFVAATFGTHDITLSDRVADVAAGSGCAQVDEHSASCPAAALTVTLGDGDDRAAVDCPATDGLCGGATLRGGSGDDQLSGNERSDVIVGGPGDDRLATGAGGYDVLRGGAGDDELMAHPTDSDRLTRVSCGPGRDDVFAQAELSLDCESFTAAFFEFRGSMRVRGDRLSLAIAHARCPFAFRWGDQGRAHRTTFHPRAWSRVTLRLPHTGGPLPHLNYREVCRESDGFFRLLFRFRNPFWEPARG
jgi:hypothetical protein